LARKRSFDVDKTLDEVMIYFWNNGFERTGYRELTKATGIKSQSLYNAYGSKNELYYQSLMHYVTVTNNAADDIVQSSKTPEQKLAALLILDWKDLPYPKGCMVMSSVSEFDNIDSKLNKVAELLFEHLKSGFVEILTSMKKEIRSDLKIDDIADEFLILHNGIQIEVAREKSILNIQKIVATSIKSIKRSDNDEINI